MFSQIGPMEIILVLLIVLVIFGPKRLPGLGKQLGSGMREFKDSLTGDRHHDDDDDEDDAKPALAAAAAPKAPADKLVAVAREKTSAENEAANEAVGRPARD